MHAAVALAFVALLLLLRAWAEPSALCRHAVWQAWNATYGNGTEPYVPGEPCRPLPPPNGTDEAPTSICGRMRIPPPAQSFHARLSPQCAAVMREFRAFGSPRSGLPPEPPNAPSPSWRKCAASHGALEPTNPVVVQRPHVAPFIVCTVPKVACTNLRKLLFAVINYRHERPERGAGFAWPLARYHTSVFPTIWHYEGEAADLSDRYPSFIIARNPYVRLVSGFLDKMVVHPELRPPPDANLTEWSEPGHDWWNLRDVNKALGREETESFEATAESFAHFVALLSRAGVGDAANSHFRLAARACDAGAMQYEYLLRLEDLPRWLPCVAGGLGIDAFVWSGWHFNETDGLQFTAAELARARHGRIAGPGVTKGGPACWWAPEGVSCGAFWRATRGAGGRAVPYEERVGSTPAQDGHDTGATDVWRRFFTQAVGDTVWRLYRSDFSAFRYERGVFDQPTDGTASPADEFGRRKRSAFGALAPTPAPPPDAARPAEAPLTVPRVEPVLVDESASVLDWDVVGESAADSGRAAALPRSEVPAAAGAPRHGHGKKGPRAGKQKRGQGAGPAAGAATAGPSPPSHAAVPRARTDEEQALEELQRLAHAP